MGYSIPPGDGEQPHPEYRIREMALDDLPIVYALGERLFTAEKWPVLFRTWDAYELVGLFATDGEYCLVAETDGNPVVGFALATLVEKRQRAVRIGYLLWMGVDPDYTRHGIGRQLVDSMTRLFIENGAQIMQVDTAADNVDALRFFRKLGFGDELAHLYLTRDLTDALRNSRTDEH